jgi:hypothetical protein
MIDFRIIKSPEPIRASEQQEHRIIADVTDMFESEVTLYASTRVLSNENLETIVSENESGLIDPKRWRVNMAYPMDRSCIQQFKSVPLDILNEYWRKTINIRDAELKTFGSNIFRFENSDYFGSRKVTCFFLWPEIDALPINPTIGNIREADNAHKTIQWMFENAPEIIPFTDADTIFLDPVTEVIYISDLMG